MAECDWDTNVVHVSLKQAQKQISGICFWPMN